MSIWKAALLSVLIPAAALPAVAQGQGPQGPQGPMAGQGPMAMFERFDIDGDGTVTRDEVANAPQLRFEAADADGNGMLSRDELIARATQEALDRVARGVDRMIERADADGDGALSFDEMADARPERGDGPMRGAREGRGREEGLARRGGMPDPAQIFERVDADGDGVVTEEEFESAMANFMQHRGAGRRGHGGWGGRG